MDQPLKRFTVKTAMIVVALMGLVLATRRPTNKLYQYAADWSYSTHYGPNTSVLPKGMKVRIVEDAPSGESTIPAGTAGVVVSDPPDEDSAYAHRSVGVRISEGPGKGTAIDVKRTSLRAR